LEYLLSIMRDQREDKRDRLDAAKAAAPYCHARLASTELSGPNDGPIETREVTDEMRARALAAFFKKTSAKCYFSYRRLAMRAPSRQTALKYG
jgi:hypothetical protein